ncbi:hypothetical protein UCDDS831_g08725 [Diplodia seriata]|uniref:Uncharacterized protein n=1 Tax=Diplodia seriata TaxID=420778 RepID=A0A0G2DSV4_9PEZI|nr:hypothetical protein UCDDS831_g08725 [Diplodia seriata]
MKSIPSRQLTVYILAHKEKDTTIDALTSLMKLSFTCPQVIAAMLDDPFHIHATLSSLSFEASKLHVGKFRRFMHAKMELVHDHLEGLINTDRDKLGSLTADLQVMSQNADSHIANADVAIRCADALCAAHARLHALLPPPPGYAQARDTPVADLATYVLASLHKQKMWFVNYKSRKDGAMNLVYNLVTQNDAGNNLSIARDMRRDSASMSAIAALTMVFLPGTFTATFLDAGIWYDLRPTSLWWVWLALTVPLTLLVFASWRVYHAHTMIKVAGGKAPRYRGSPRSWAKVLRR